LGFEDRPDYDYLKKIFRELFFRRGFSYDDVFDWSLLGTEAPPAVFCRITATDSEADNPQTADATVVKGRVLPPVMPQEEAICDEHTVRGKLTTQMPSVVNEEAQRTYRVTRSQTSKEGRFSAVHLILSINPYFGSLSQDNKWLQRLVFRTTCFMSRRSNE
jgi:hypothetical protein